MRVPDHYAALGIQSTADASDIRKAYKKRALQTHPDKGGDEEEFKRVGAAYAVLSDQDKRRDYDEMRTDGLREGERDQTDYQATGFNSAFDAPFFGQRWDPGEKFSMDDARAQFDRFFGTQSPFANLSTPSARKVTQISTIRRRDGRMESMARTRSEGAKDEYEFFNQGHVLHGGRCLCGNQNFTARSESSRRPPRHRRDACSMAWRCRFLARDARVDFHTGRGHINPGLPPNASGPGSPWKPVEERREKKGMTPLQMAAAARTRRRSGTRTDRLEGRPLGRSETGPPALGL
jgi:hypothetical protein